MGVVDVARTLAQLPALITLKKGMQPRPFETRDSIGATVQRTADAFSDRPAVLFEGRTLSWGELNALANRYADAFKAQGLARGDATSVLMENRIEFLATVIALNKLGVTAALINTNLRGRPLIHCTQVTDSRKLVFGAELASAVDEVKEQLPLTEGEDFLWVADPGQPDSDGRGNWAQDFTALAESAGDTNPPETGEVTLGDSAFYIFTSGTTGLPKAAVLSNRRYLMSATLAHKAGLKCTHKDRLYLCLPLYHGTGLMIGLGAALSSGARMFVRRKFSASNFLAEVREHETSCFIYIGELCRYLMNTPARPDDHKNPLTRMMGNGLRPDIWVPFKRRFGIKRITEFYGASEGNIAFVNLLNKDCTVGMTSARHALVKYDVDADEIVRDAFEEGDAWFNTGDLMRQVDAGYTLGYPHYQFVDRVGDTFRWKSENVSTNEVGEIINGFPQIRFSNVYGVQIPGTDGRAGMAALTLEEGVDQLDLDAFSDHVNRNLPHYARPVFLRVEPEIDVTGTFKMVKGKLREEAYDLDRVTDSIYVMKPGSERYEPLDREFLEKIRRGEEGY